MAKKKKHGSHHWEGIDPDPCGNMGFIYLITNNINGRMYVGKKQYWAAAQRVKGCKSKISDKQSPKWKDKCWRGSDWRVYTGSSKNLNADIKEYGKKNFTFEILKNCRSKGVLHYAEIEEQVIRGVLWRLLTKKPKKHLYYNKQIAACKFRPPDFFSDGRRAAISEKLTGRPCANKGKKMPGNAPKTPVMEGSIQVTNGEMTIWMPKEFNIPKGWRVGVTKALEREYPDNPTTCRECGASIPYKKRHYKTCSTDCKVVDTGKIRVGKSGIPGIRFNTVDSSYNVYIRIDKRQRYVGRSVDLKEAIALQEYHTKLIAKEGGE